MISSFSFREARTCADNGLLLGNAFDFVLVVMIVLYCFFDPIGGFFGLNFLKKPILAGIFMLWFAWLFASFASLNVKFHRPPLILGAFLILLCVQVSHWDSLAEINLMLSPFIGWMLFRRSRYFMPILKLLVILQFCCLCIEFVTGRYLYADVETGFILNEQRKDDYKDLTDSAFKTTGFRGKGLFQGTLVSSTFVINTSFIFLGNVKWQLIILLMAGMTNGRLAIIIAFVSLVVGALVSGWVSKRNVLSALVTVIVITMFSSMYILFQSEDAIANIGKVFDMKSSANASRLIAFAIGVAEYHRYGFVDKLIGRSGYIYTVNPSGAESEWINHLLNIGLFGTLLYAWLPVSLLYRSIRLKKVDLFVICFLSIVSLLVYRHTAGPMRGVLFWYLFFYMSETDGV